MQPQPAIHDRKEWLRAHLVRIDRKLAPHCFPRGGRQGPPDMRHPARKLASAMAAAGGKFIGEIA